MAVRSNSGLVGLLGVALAFGLWASTSAGVLEPPGSPAPTMVTLQEIYDKLDGCTGGGLCGVPKTGQTECWDASGTAIECAGTGQDGEYQAGTSVSPRFTVNGDGTVTDNLTGLVWLQDADCFGPQVWANALSLANTLATGSCGLADSSVAGDWRLPDVRQLHSLIDFGRNSPALPPDHPFSGVQSHGYWSSTTYAITPTDAWAAHLYNGDIITAVKTTTTAFYVWPVRGGQ